MLNCVHHQLNDQSTFGIFFLCVYTKIPLLNFSLALKSTKYRCAACNVQVIV